MLIVADTHAHVYPHYDVGAALSHATANLQRLAAGFERRTGASLGEGHGTGNDEGAATGECPMLPVLLLAEARGCRFFEDLVSGRVAEKTSGLGVEVTGDRRAAWVRHDRGDATQATAAAGGGDSRFEATGSTLLIVQGRQIVTRERLEILSLTVDIAVPADTSLAEAIDAVREAGGAPVLSWAPGKWSGARGKIVAALLEEHAPQDILLGDSTLRARSWREPALMRRARRLGYRTVAGSDALPIAGEEGLLGSYGVAWEGEGGHLHPTGSGGGAAEPLAADPVTALRRMLLDPEIPLTTVGRRPGAVRVLSRLARHTLASKLAGSGSTQGKRSARSAASNE